MKNFLCAFVLICGITFGSNTYAQASLTLTNCESWERFVNATDNIAAENLLTEIKKTNPAIPELHEAQRETKTWTRNRAIMPKTWDDLTKLTKLSEDKKSQIPADILDEQNWKTQDLEYIYAVRACDAAMNTKDSPEKESALLQKATLHIERATMMLKKVQTVNRMPFVRHGNVLPGTTTEGDAADYVENRFIPKFVNASLVFLISLSVLMLIIGGLMLLFAGGDSDATAQAKTTVMWSIVGVVITILSYAMVQFIIGIDFFI